MSSFWGFAGFADFCLRWTGFFDLGGPGSVGPTDPGPGFVLGYVFCVVGLIIGEFWPLPLFTCEFWPFSSRRTEPWPFPCPLPVPTPWPPSRTPLFCPLPLFWLCPLPGFVGSALIGGTSRSFGRLP